LPQPERDFGTVRQLPAIPNIQDYRNTSFVSLDNSGKKSIVMQGESGRDVAFYERQAGSAQGWSTQQMFPNTLNAQSWKKQLGRVDLTGTGRNDILFIEDDSTFSWHENQGKKGFGPLRRSRPIPDASTLTVGDGDYDRTARYFTDMTGDGLEDILEISHGRVSYWPNLGHGRFGPEVLMANPPLIPGGDQRFDSQRLLLLDADGIGTTDVAYLLPDGGALVYLNHCGNSWSEPFHLPQVPRIDNLARVFSVDLLGTGTRCLCWTVPEHGSCSSETVIRYINLSALGKPHLLTGIDNSLGRNTRIAYCASTRDSQMAEKSGTPWISNLPFPVQIVRKTVERDRFTHSVKTTKYVYRDGAFDRHEGEFCGFGRVETWQSEETRLYDSSESPNKTKYVGPVLYHRQWFHTGVEEAAVEPRDSFGGPPQIQTSLDLPLGKPFIAGCRALRGLQSRLEVYGLDKGQDSKSAVPYYVQDTAYAVEMVALSGPVLSAYAVCRTMTQQSLTTTYERIRANPRMSQALVLAWNEFGDATETVTIHYGASEAGASISTTADRTLQMQHHALLTKNTYTENHIDSLDEYCTSVLAASIVFRLEDFTAPGDQIIATLASIRAQVGQYSMHNRVSSTRILYFNEEMSGGLDKNRMPTTGPALVFQNFEEAVTDLQRQQSYGRSGLTLACRSIKDLVQVGGYLDLDDNGCWWRSSNRVYFSDTADDLPESNLAAARAGFFTPRRAVDAFGAISRVEMDALSLLVILSEDAEGKRTTVDIDYRTLSPSKIVDINENRTYIQRDAFARDSAVWMVEKKDGQIEDQPLNAEPFVCQDDTLVSQLIQFVEKPMESAAWELLGSATSRRLRTNTIHKTASGLIIPPLELELCRTHHGVEATGSLDQAPEVQIAATMTHHVTGKEPLQTASVRDWDPKHPQWVIAGVARRNLSEFSLRTYHPCLSTSPMLRTACKEFETASLTLTDALQRLVVTLYPDHTWSKTVHATWKSTHYNTGDMLHAIDPSTDPDIGKLFSALPLPAAFLPSWLETRKQSDVGSSDRLAAERAESTNPPGQNRVGIESHVDSRGRTILVANYHNADQFRSQEFQYDDHGRVTREVDSLGRIILYRLYDRPGNLLLSAEQDSGVKVSVYAADGLAILVEDARGVCQRLEYDALRRHRATWVMHAPGQPEILWDETEYAKDAKSAVTNSRGRVIAIRDQAGLRTFPKHDMRGNAIVEKTQLARVYNEAIDWNAGAGAHSSTLDNSLVEPETYSSLTFVDLLNRPWLTSDALGHGTKRTFLLSSKDPIVVQMWSKAKDAVSWEPHVLESIYSADNLPTMVEYGNGCTTRSKYDSCSRKILEKQTRRATDGRIIEQLSYTHDHLRQLVYEHDAAQKEVYFRNNRVTPVREFWYDAWGRLKRSSGREIVNAGIGTTKSQSNVTEALAKLGYDGSGNGNNDQQVVNFVESYEYDGADNILSVRHMVSDAQTASWKRTYAYNEPSFTDPGRFGDRLSSTQMGGGVLDNYKYGLESEAHGASGYITAGSGFAKMEWDALGRLRSVSRTASGAEKTWFVYDSAGRRVRKLTDRRQTASDGGSDDYASNRIKIKETRYLAERADVIFKHTKGLDEVQLSRSNIHSCPHAIREEASPLVIIEQTKADGELLMRYALSVCLEVSGQGVIISYEEYSAFGSSVFAASIAIPREFRFAACRRDDETGFIHCGSRYLIPGLGRWLSPDPIGSAGGANVYAYCWNDPVNLDDRTGLVPPSPNSFAANVFPVTPKGRRDAVKKVVNWGASAFGLFVAQHFFNPDPNTQALERNMIGGAIGYVVGDLLVGNLVNYGLSLASPAFRLPEPTQPVNGAQAEPAAEQEENDLEIPVANNQNEVPENQADVILDQIEMPNGQVLGNINDNANNEGLDDEGHITLPDVSENAGNVEANMANRIVPVSRHGYSINIDI
jgi:RHS repeat-associated protein